MRAIRMMVSAELLLDALHIPRFGAHDYQITGALYFPQQDAVELTITSDNSDFPEVVDGRAAPLATAVFRCEQLKGWPLEASMEWREPRRITFEWNIPHECA